MLDIVQHWALKQNTFGVEETHNEYPGEVAREKIGKIWDFFPTRGGGV